jgi:hypothetical protein
MTVHVTHVEKKTGLKDRGPDSCPEKLVSQPWSRYVRCTSMMVLNTSGHVMQADYAVPHLDQPGAWPGLALRLVHNR